MATGSALAPAWYGWPVQHVKQTFDRHTERPLMRHFILCHLAPGGMPVAGGCRRSVGSLCGPVHIKRRSKAAGGLAGFHPAGPDPTDGQDKRSWEKDLL
jgi:hypothetical protein